MTGLSRQPRTSDYAQLHIRLREKEAQAVHDAAEAEGVTITAWVGEAIRQRLTKQSRAKRP